MRVHSTKALEDGNNRNSSFQEYYHLSIFSGRVAGLGLFEFERSVLTLKKTVHMPIKQTSI